MKKIINYTLIFGVIFLQACSSTSLGSFGYRYGDWLLKKRILKYVKLYSPQQDKLDVVLDDYMKWHENVMLSRYQSEIEHIQKLLETPKKIDDKLIYNHLGHIRTLYYESFYGLSDRISPILALLGEQQVDRTQKILNDNLDEVKENAKVDKGQLILEARESWYENVEDWIGPLKSDQRNIIKKHSDSLMIHPRKKMAIHGDRIQRFISIYDSEKNRQEKLRKFFRAWSKGNNYASWRKKLATLMAEILKSLDSEQMAHLKAKLDEYRQLLTTLQKD